MDGQALVTIIINISVLLLIIIIIIINHRVLLQHIVGVSLCSCC